MGEIARYLGRTFVVSSSRISGFGGLDITTGLETEEHTLRGIKYYSMQNTRPVDISFAIHLDRMLGCSDVLAEAEGWMADSRRGLSDYLYVGGHKILPMKYMLVEVNVSNIQLNGNGVWLSCDLDVKLQQGRPDDGTQPLPESSPPSNGGSDSILNTNSNQTGQQGNDSLGQIGDINAAEDGRTTAEIVSANANNRNSDSAKVPGTNSNVGSVGVRPVGGTVLNRLTPTTVD